MKDNLIIAGGILGVVAVISGVLVLAGGMSYSDPLADARKQLDDGNYLAALALFGGAENTESSDAENQANLEKTKRLLVAEEIFLKAKQIAVDGRWPAVVALLEAVGAQDDPLFKYRGEAKALLDTAIEHVQASNKIVQDEISALNKSIEIEKSLGKQAELRKSALQKSLNLTALEKQKADLLVDLTKKSVEDAQKRASDIQSQLEQEQKKVFALAAAAEREQTKKFVSELALYMDIVNRGNELLNNTINEIDQNRDVSALALASQARTLFADAKVKSEDLRANRTVSQYTERVDQLIRASVHMSEAAKYLGTSVLYIQDRGGSEFTRFYSEGKRLQSAGKELIEVVRNFIQSSR